MRTRVVIRDMQDEEDFELSGVLTPGQVERLTRIAEQVAQGTGWRVTITTEGRK